MSHFGDLTVRPVEEDVMSRQEAKLKAHRNVFAIERSVGGALHSFVISKLGNLQRAELSLNLQGSRLNLIANQETNSEPVRAKSN